VSQTANGPGRIQKGAQGRDRTTAAFWLYAAYRDKYTDAAILTAILFAGGLAAGRCVSLIADGRPAFMLLTYLAAEIGVVLIGYWVFASKR